jgi:glycosyltransferase involved in cell wall biosynthesis
MNNPNKESDCQVSFVVIAYNAEKTIRGCIESILNQLIEKEVILINNNSTDSTVDRVNDLEVKILFESERNRGVARNYGLEAANGQYIAFVDADVELPKDWAIKALNLLENHPEVIAAGGPGISPDNSLVSQSLNILQYGNHLNNKENYVKSLATMDVMYRRDIIRKIRFTKYWTAEDAEFNFQLAEKGYKFLWSRDLLVVHHHATTFNQLVSKSYSYGQWYLAPYLKHPKQINLEVVIRIIYFPLLFLLTLFFVLWSSFWWVFALWGIFPVFGYIFFLIRYRLTMNVQEAIKIVLVHSVKQYAQMAGIWGGIFGGTWRYFA